MGGRDAAVFAESPRKVVFLTPADVVGATSLQITKGALSASGEFYILGLKLNESNTDLRRGQTATLSIIVTGLQQLTESATLTMVNRSPQIVTLAGGPLQQIPISPGKVGPGGRFQLSQTLTAIGDGKFEITVVVSRPPTADIPIQQVVNQAIDIWYRDNGIPSPREREP